MNFGPKMNRRSFLADAGMGCAGLALGSLLFKDGVARAGDATGPGAAPTPDELVRVRELDADQLPALMPQLRLCLKSKTGRRRDSSMAASSSSASISGVRLGI